MSVNSLVSSHYGKNGGADLYGNMHNINNSSFQHQVEVQVEPENQPSAPVRSQKEAVSFEFGVHLAEGSKRCYVSNFASMVELYEKIAQCFDISPKEVRLTAKEIKHEKGYFLLNKDTESLESDVQCHWRQKSLSFNNKKTLGRKELQLSPPLSRHTRLNQDC